LQNQSLTAKRIFLNALLILTVAGIPVFAQGQGQDFDYDAERRRAFALLDESKMLEALPILEKLAAKNDKDPEVQFMLGFCIVAKSIEVKDPEQRKQERLRARRHLVKAKELGVTEPVLDKILAGIPLDGSEVPAFSRDPKIEAVMNEGESAYARGDLKTALAAYERALRLDPKLYEAALFAGDMQFKRAHISTDAPERKLLFDSAGDWFTKAIRINPDRETAYRYWGDALLEYGKDDEALGNFIEAIVAEPYSQLTYNGITKWAQKNDRRLGHPRIDIPSRVSSKKPGEVSVTVDGSALKGSDNDGSAAWVMYGMVRALWSDKKEGRSEEFARAYPNEKVYRHSLAEEAAALRAVITSVKEQTRENKIKQLTPALEKLMKLSDAGLLESYILFAMPDRGIANDYISYRNANRDKLKRYWSEVAILK